ncbi:MAG: PilX N-terminal domain-containing pilus assembly protein [Steroidobacteraceae bacterium]
MNPSPRIDRQSGAALVVGLVLLMILTLLAITGVNTSTTELIMAGNEQYHRAASEAAGAGIELAMGTLAAVPTSPGAAPTVAGPTAMPSSPGDSFTTSTRYMGDETNLPQSSVNKFIGLHFQIDSSGTSARNAQDQQRQGVFVVSGNAGGAQNSFGQLGGGLP